MTPKNLYQLSVWDWWSPLAIQVFLDDVHWSLVSDLGVSASGIPVSDELTNRRGQLIQ